MTVAALLCDLWQAGIHPRLAPDRKHLLLPANKLTDQQRHQLGELKADVLELLSDTGLQALMDAAMKACDHWRDDAQARTQMRLDCLNTPHHLRADLLAHFRASYRGRP